MLLAVEALLLVLAVGLRFVNLDADIPPQQNADDLGDEGYWFLPARDLLRFGSFDASSNFLQAEAGAPLTLATLAALAFLRGDIDYPLVRGLSALYSTLTLVLGAIYFHRLKRMPLAGVCFVALYGLLPLTLFYSRLAHVEQHVLFYLFLAFVVAERARTTKGLIAAGAIASLALAVKTVAVFVMPALVLYVLVRHRGRAGALAAFALGAAPLTIALGIHLWRHAERFAPTIAALARYHRPGGFFIDASSIEYFWRAPLVLPYLPWIAAGLAALGVVRRPDPTRTWTLLWLGTVLIALSVFPYQSYARHMLVIFPLLVATALAFGQLHEALRPAGAAALSVACVVGFTVTTWLSTGVIGHSVFLAPQLSYRDAARTLAAITDERDHVVGVHAHGLSIAGRYRPKMSLNVRSWRGVDPLEKVEVSGALVATLFNGRPRTGKWDRIFPRPEQFGYAERLDHLAYLGRFEVDVYRVFATREDHEVFRRFRQGRPSRYDGVLYNLFRDDRASGCLVKGALVAESRGDPEISHRKISATGCVGMMGFCYATAKADDLADLFTRLVPRIRAKDATSAVYEADDRFVPEKALQAGSRYLRTLKERFAPYTDRVKLTYAAYNGGPGFTSFLVERAAKADPSWENDLLPLLRTLGPREAPGYQNWPARARHHKFLLEIPYYVDDAFRTFDACMRGTRFEVSYE